MDTGVIQSVSSSDNGSIWLTEEMSRTEFYSPGTHLVTELFSDSLLLFFKSNNFYFLFEHFVVFIDSALNIKHFISEKNVIGTL